MQAVHEKQVGDDGVVRPVRRLEARMETGDLSEWDDQVDTGSAESVAVTAASVGIPPKSGNWVMRQSVTGTSGTRMARFPEIDALTKAGTTFYVSWWDYYPMKISIRCRGRSQSGLGSVPRASGRSSRS